MATRAIALLATLGCGGCAGGLFGAVNVGAPADGIAIEHGIAFAADRGLALDVYRPGYFLWLGSFALVGVGALANVGKR